MLFLAVPLPVLDIGRTAVHEFPHRNVFEAISLEEFQIKVFSFPNVAPEHKPYFTVQS